MPPPDLRAFALMLALGVAAAAPGGATDVRLWCGALFAMSLTVAFWFARTRATVGPPPPLALTSEYQRFHVTARSVANAGDRPVIFLTLPVSTAALPTGAHVRLRAPAGEGGAPVVRSYTPTRFHKGECELMFRVYEGGPMSQHLARLKVGDSVEMMGPTGQERYASHGPGTFSKGERVWRGVTHVGLISGGTGITPMLQIANHVLQDPADATRLSLLSFTTSVADVMLGDTLRGLAADSKGALRLTFVASQATGKDLEGVSDVVVASMRSLTAARLAELLGLPQGPSTVICVCGPHGFVQQAKALLAEAGFENVLVW